MLHYFADIGSEAEQRDIRYVLALLMVRRRIFRLEETQVEETGVETMVLYCPRNETEYHVEVVNVSRPRADEIQSLLTQLLVGRWWQMKWELNLSELPRCHLLRCVLWLALPSIISGCMFSREASNPAPIAFTAPPTAAQIVETVNANSQRVQQLHASDVRLTVPGQLVSLRATLDFERERRFRLSGRTGRTGAELDLGSNDEMFWLWVRQMQPPTVFYGRHDQYFQSAAQEILPMPPHWIVEALGVVYLDPGGVHEGPYASPTPGRVQIRTHKPTPRGSLLHVLEIDQRHGFVLQQQIYGPNQELLASATAADFRYDPLQNVSLPHEVRVDLPPADMSFSLQVSAYVLNQSHADPLTLWSMPELPSHAYRDIANPADMQGISLTSPLAQGRAAPGFLSASAVTTSQVGTHSPGCLAPFVILCGYSVSSPPPERNRIMARIDRKYGPFRPRNRSRARVKIPSCATDMTYPFYIAVRNEEQDHVNSPACQSPGVDNWNWVGQRAVTKLHSSALKDNVLNGKPVPAPDHVARMQQRVDRVTSAYEQWKSGADSSFPELEFEALDSALSQLPELGPDEQTLARAERGTPAGVVSCRQNEPGKVPGTFLAANETVG